MAASLTSMDLAAAESTLDPVNILLVDDQPARLLAYRVILGSLNENLVEASSGTEALALLMTREFALILLDVNMPDMDGFEAASLIHQHPRFEKTPIIFVTAINVSDMDRIRGYTLGAVDYVMVPIIPEILRSKVTVLAELYRKRRDLELANAHLAAANESLRIEKSRELEVLNESLRLANIQLEHRNLQLQREGAERERAQQRLIEQDRRKDEFLAMLAHELRNPIASLANAINVFKLGAVRIDPLHEAMQRQLGLLVRLIDDLIDAARISSGKLTLRKAPTTLRAIIESAVETVTPLLDAGTHPLDVQQPAEDIGLDADAERLSQVFSNLLSNAVKYSDIGSPIEIAARATDDSVEISFIDHGIGLGDDQQERIFELFTQVDTAVERARGGLGIGLALARRIVEMHEGQLSVESPGLGRGSCFVVRLPRTDLGEIPMPSSIPAPAIAQSGGQCRVLVVDDNQDAADTLAMMLQLLGHQAHCIYDPRAVVDAVDAFVPDIVFLDIGMPGLSGYDVARNLRAHPGGDSLILVAVTGWGQPEDRRRTAENGFDHHLVKPADLAEIQRICNSFAQRTHDSG
ncbi:MAG: response regulator [Dokdonella sp.]